MTDHDAHAGSKPASDKHASDKPASDTAHKPPPAPTLSAAPELELELKLKKNPHDDDAKVDVGSDQSMDASDPVAVTAPGGNEPAPSSGFPQDK